MKCKRRAEVVTHTFDVVPHFVVGTDRVATVATRLARKYAKFLPLKLLPLPVEIPPMIEVLQWHKYHDQDPAYVGFGICSGRSPRGSWDHQENKKGRRPREIIRNAPRRSRPAVHPVSRANSIERHTCEKQFDRERIAEAVRMTRRELVATINHNDTTYAIKSFAR